MNKERTHQQRFEDAVASYVRKVPAAAEGERNASAFSLAGHLRAFVGEPGGLTLSEQAALVHVCDWNSANSDPLPLSELRECVSSAWQENGTPRSRKVIDLVKRVKRSASTQRTPSTVIDEPIPVSLPFKPFPIDAMPKEFRCFVDVGAAAIGCDPTFIALPLLAAAAAAIGNTRVIELKSGWREPCVLWTAIIGESGSLKSPGLELALRPVREHQRRAMQDHAQQVSEHEADCLKYERDLAAWKRSKAPTEPPQKPAAPVADRFIVDDITIEAVAARHEHQPRGLLAGRDELSGWMSGFDRYSNGRGADCARWLELHGGRPLVIDRKTSGTIYIPRASMSLTGGIQPAVLRRHISGEYVENGLAARLLLAEPPRRPKRWSEAGIHPVAVDAISEVFRWLYHMQFETSDEGESLPIAVPLSQAAKAAWVRFYNEFANEQAELSGGLAAAFSKIEGAAARLALVTHCVRWASGEATTDETHVDEQSIEAGVAMARWFAHEATRIYSMWQETDEQREQRELVELIDRKGGDISSRELVHSTRKYPTVSDAEAALSDLAASGIGKWKHPPQLGRGRPPAKRLTLCESRNVHTVNVNQNTTAGIASGNIVDAGRGGLPETQHPTASKHDDVCLNGAAGGVS